MTKQGQEGIPISFVFTSSCCTLFYSKLSCFYVLYLLELYITYIRECIFYIYPQFQIADRLDNASEVDLDLELVTPPFDDITVYRQGNIQASRKKVMPVLQSFLHGDITPDVASKEFVSQTSVAMTTEGFSSLGDMKEPSVESNVVFNLGSVEGEQSMEGIGASLRTPSLEMSDSENLNSSNLVTMGTGKAAMDMDFDPFQTISSPSPGENVFQNNVVDSKFGESFLSSANSSNLLDFAVSDSELVDPFSSMEDTVQPNVTHSMPMEKTNQLSLSDSIDSKGEKNIEKQSENPNLNPFFDFDAQAATGSVSYATAANNSINPFSNSIFGPVEGDSNVDGGLDKADLNVDFSNNTGALLDFTDSGKLAVAGTEAVSGMNQFNDLAMFEGTKNSDETIEAAEEPSTWNSNQDPFGLFGDVSDQVVDLAECEKVNSDKDSNVCDPTSNEVSEKDDISEGLKSESRDIENSIFDVDSLSVSTPPLNEKSISLIVECDSISQADNLAELDESDLFDKVPTPEILHSGENSPFVNSGVSTPFEMEPGRRLRMGSESGADVPPNSLMDLGFDLDHTDRGLPSFNSAEMVERIHKKKASLGMIDIMETESERLTTGEYNQTTPYTPQNSFRDDMESYMIERSLPSFNNSNIVEKVQQKRNSLGAGLGVSVGDTEHLGEDPSNFGSESGNPFGDFSDNFTNNNFTSSASEQDNVGNPFLNIDDDKDADRLDSLDHVPFTPSNTFVDTSLEKFMKNRNSLTDPELMFKLNELKLEKDGQGTNPFELSGESVEPGTNQQQTGSQDLFDIFGSGTAQNEDQSTVSGNPFTEGITSGL